MAGKEETKWQVVERRGRGKSGCSWFLKEKRRWIAPNLQEAITLEDEYTDKEGNITKNFHARYHYIALFQNKHQTYFAFKVDNGWRVLSDDCLSYRRDCKTREEAIEILKRKEVRV